MPIVNLKTLTGITALVAFMMSMTGCGNDAPPEEKPEAGQARPAKTVSRF